MKILSALFVLLLVLTAPAFAKDVTLQWDPSPTSEVAGYSVCHSTTDGLLVGGQQLPAEGVMPVCVDAGLNLTITIPNLDDATPYYFGVVAYNEAQQKSALSNIVMSPGFYIPEPAANLRGTSTINNVDVPVR